MTDNLSLFSNDDTLLVAYLDNELKGDQRRALEKRLQHDEALSTRLSQLEQTQFDFGAAFSPMLDQAPVAEMQSRLDKLAYIPTAEATRVGLSRRSLLAAALSFLMIGAGVGRFVLSPDPDSADQSWRDRVAQYMSLYTADTLADVSDSPALQQQELNRVAKEVGIALKTPQLKITGAQLKNARILRYDDYNIAQISWLDEKYGPLALCITPSSRAGAQAQIAEKRLGMNVVYWRREGYNFMLIGRAPERDIQQQGVELLNNIS